jgi:hypothetical protein
MIPGVEDALIFVKLTDGTVHQIDLPKWRTHHLLASLGKELRLCEQAEPMTWERPEEKKEEKPPLSPIHHTIKEKFMTVNDQGEPVEVGEYLSKTKYLDTKTGELKLY